MVVAAKQKSSSLIAEQIKPHSDDKIPVAWTECVMKCQGKRSEKSFKAEQDQNDVQQVRLPAKAYVA